MLLWNKLHAEFPLVGAILSDTFLGNYCTISTCCILVYLPGLLLIALVAKPYLLGETFSMSALYSAYLFFLPCGAGAIKSCVNIMGAQQFHPILQKAQIEKFYIYFYSESMC